MEDNGLITLIVDAVGAVGIAIAGLTDTAAIDYVPSVRMKSEGRILFNSLFLYFPVFFLGEQSWSMGMADKGYPVICFAKDPKGLGLGVDVGPGLRILRRGVTIADIGFNQFVSQ